MREAAALSPGIYNRLSLPSILMLRVDCGLYFQPIAQQRMP
jgi:hypothetical protein